MRFAQAVRLSVPGQFPVRITETMSGRSVDPSDTRLGLLVCRGRVEGHNPAFPRCEESTPIPENPPYGFRRFRYPCGHH